MAIVKYTTDTGEEVDSRSAKFFEEGILDELDTWTIKDYAIDNLDLVDEDEVEEKNICDFDDSEIEKQYFINLGLTLNIVNSSFVSRFFKVIEIGDSQEIEEFLKQQEQKNKIV